jgi:hypothetical protein
MTPAIDFDCDEIVVRDLLEPLARVQPVKLQRRPNRQPARRFRPAFAIAAGAAALMLVAAGVAAATGVLPGWQNHQAIIQSPFMTATNPAALPGSIVNFSAPLPESATFEIVTNDTETVGTLHEHCTAIVALDAQGRSLTDFPGLRGCGTHPRTESSEAAGIQWQSRSGATYAVIYGAGAAPSAAKVALVAGDGETVATAPVKGGHYLVYAPFAQAAGNLVFYNPHGQVVDKLDSPSAYSG